MSKIKQILDKFYHDEHSATVANKVYQRMMEPSDKEEQEAALHDIWQELGFPHATAKTETALYHTERRLGLKPSIGRVQRLLKTARHNGLRVAALWVVPLVSILLSLYFYHNMSSALEVKLVQEYVPNGQKKKVTLPDGSTVWLNGGTLFIYPTTFAKANRNVFISGEAQFNIHRNEKKPFVVNTSEYNVHVLGTVFNVSCYPNESTSTTTLSQGSVEVRWDNDTQTQLLTPNEQLIYNALTHTFTKSEVNASLASNWIDGFLSFNVTPFETVLRRLERTYGVHFHLLNTSYADHIITANFNKDESINTVMMVIESIIPGFRYEIAGQEVYVR